MRDLSPEARLVLDAACDGDASTVAQRDRVAERLAARLGATALVAASTTVASSAAAGGAGVAVGGLASGLAAKLVVGAVLVAGLAGTGVAWRSHARHATQAGRVAMAVQPLAARPLAARPSAARSAATGGFAIAPDVAPAPPAATVGPPADRGAVRSSVRPLESADLASGQPAVVRVARAATLPAADTLPEESRLFGQAHAALRAGDARRALALLDDHDRRFARGALREECVAARVQALCALGRVDDARAAADALTRTAPRSPAVETLRGSCAAVDVTRGTP